MTINAIYLSKDYEELLNKFNELRRREIGRLELHGPDEAEDILDEVYRGQGYCKLFAGVPEDGSRVPVYLN